MLGDVQKVDSSLESTRAIRTSIAKSLPLESTTALESTFKKWILGLSIASISMATALGRVLVPFAPLLRQRTLGAFLLGACVALHPL